MISGIAFAAVLVLLALLAFALEAPAPPPVSPLVGQTLVQHVDETGQA